MNGFKRGNGVPKRQKREISSMNGAMVQDTKTGPENQITSDGRAILHSPSRKKTKLQVHLKTSPLQLRPPAKKKRSPWEIGHIRQEFGSKSNVFPSRLADEVTWAWEGGQKSLLVFSFADIIAILFTVYVRINRATQQGGQNGPFTCTSSERKEGSFRPGDSHS